MRLDHLESWLGWEYRGIDKRRGYLIENFNIFSGININKIRIIRDIALTKTPDASKVVTFYPKAIKKC